MLKDLQVDEKPRERLVNNGVQNLSDAELLAIILRSGGRNQSAVDLARNLIKTFGTLGELLTADIHEITKHRYVGFAKATSIKATGEISRRFLTGKAYKQRIFIKNPGDIFNCTRGDFFQKKTERLYLLSLNVRNVLISKDLISEGNATETSMYPSEIFKKALSRNAVLIVLVHNHPSGNINPSTEDLKVTETIARIGRDLGIPLIDHVIVNDTSYYSLKETHLFNTHKFEPKKGGE